MKMVQSRISVFRSTVDIEPIHGYHEVICGTIIWNNQLKYS